jgi:multiple sugar transport system substrate-binding protein
MTNLKGITWDHPRGYQPLRAIADAWNKKGGVQVDWDVRSLKAFGDDPIEKLISRYDLVVIDHPYVGSAAADKLLLPLDEHLPAAFMKIQEDQSLGPCFESYRYAGHHWALPIDAAAQVAAFRDDLIDAIKWTPPAVITELAQAAARLPEGKKMGVPLCPTDIWCVFLSLCALYSDGSFFSEKGIDTTTGEWALDQILSWKTFLFSGSFSMNPIQMLEHMAAHDDLVYIPYTFGYTNYARKEWRQELIHFCDSPGHGRSYSAPLLGGAGLAIAAQTEYPQECLEWMQFILSQEMQNGLYFQQQGQPAHLSAWLDKANDAACSGFFSGTMHTMQHAYVRPRHEGFNRFQEAAASHIHQAATAWMTTGAIEIKGAVRKLNEMYKNILHGEIPAY